MSAAASIAGLTNAESSGRVATIAIFAFPALDDFVPPPEDEADDDPPESLEPQPTTAMAAMHGATAPSQRALPLTNPHSPFAFAVSASSTGQGSKAHRGRGPALHPRRYSTVVRSEVSSISIGLG